MTSSNPNLVPTIESSALPSPANEWAESTNSMLAHKFKPSTPLDGPAPPGSLPDQGQGGSTLLDSLPAKEDVHRTIGKAAKAILPERVAAYLPVSESELAPPRPPFASQDTDRSNLSNLSTEAQAGSLMPPRADSASTLSTLSSAAPARDGADSQLSTTVHTGGSATPHPVSPLSASPLSKSVERLPVDADGATPPAFTASPRASSLRFARVPAVVERAEHTERGTARAAELARYGRFGRQCRS
ncbi:hypothetical protein B0H14DRAFT_3871209 [Mycena olivaceomarginata]|nr:hypothetical protein B0H14DRAFT_3871209 [Mycena olivaceomarginata]